MASFNKQAIGKTLQSEYQIVSGTVEGDVKIWSTTNVSGGGQINQGQGNVSVQSTTATNSKFFIRSGSGKLVEISAPYEIAVNSGHKVTAILIRGYLIAIYNKETDYRHWFPEQISASGVTTHSKGNQAAKAYNRLTRAGPPAISWGVGLLTLPLFGIGILWGLIIAMVRSGNETKAKNWAAEYAADVAAQHPIS